MECCLYCGEPIALLQRWKLGRAKGMFCSKEHEEAHTRLQAQAILRLMMPRGAEGEEAGDEVTVTADEDEESPELAPPVMSAKPRDSVARFSPVLHPKPVTRQPAHPPRKPFGPCFAIADYVAVPITAGLPEALVPMSPGEYEAHSIPLPEVAALNRVCSVGLELAGLVNIDLNARGLHGIGSRLVVAEFDIPMMLPRLTIDRRMAFREPGRVSIGFASYAGEVAIRRGSGWVDAQPTFRSLRQRRLAARVLNAGAISLRGHSHARSEPTLICGQAGERWAEREISLQLPQMEAPMVLLDRAGTLGFSIIRDPRFLKEIRNCEPLAWAPGIENPQFGGGMTICPQLPCAVRLPLELIPCMRFDPAVAPSEDRLDVKIVFPASAGFVEGEIPEFQISSLVGPPIGPRPEDGVVQLPVQLLALRRGANEMGRARSPLPGFKAIRLEILTVPAEPIFSLAPLRFTRAKAQAAVC